MKAAQISWLIVAVCFISIGCAVAPSSQVNSIQDKNYLLGLYPTDNTDTADRAYNLLICPMLPSYDAKTIKSLCRQALVTKYNRPVIFTNVHPEISKWFGQWEAGILAMAFLTPLIINAFIETGHLASIGAQTVGLASIILLVFFDEHFWGANKRELGRVHQSIFTKDNFRDVLQTKKSLATLLPLLAKHLDLKVSREAQRLLSFSYARENP
ncbi:MAG: hypothetical protein OYH77_07570 [Pseudomonadota bacterium]|nr:hypothetical protein [Pseudomonadota bacterium]